MWAGIGVRAVSLQSKRGLWQAHRPNATPLVGWGTVERGCVSPMSWGLTVRRGYYPPTLRTGNEEAQRGR